MRKSVKKWLILVASCLLMLGLSSCGGKTIDLNDYVKVEIGGYDGYGTAQVVFDTEKFDEDYSSMKFKSSDNLYAAYYKTAANCVRREFVNYELDKISGLSNGDAVELKWTCDSESIKKLTGYSVSFESIEVKVSGLSSVSTFDGFEGIEVKFTGYDTQGMAEVVINSTSERIASLNYEIEKKYELSNGDKIKLVITNVSSELQVNDYISKYNEVPETIEKEIVVDGLKDYFNSVAGKDVSMAKEVAEKVYKDHWLNYEGNMDGLKSLTYVGNYFYYRPVEDSVYTIQNKLYMVYKVDCTWDGVDYPHYVYVGFSNIYVDNSGNIAVDADDFELTTSTYHPENNWSLSYKGFGTIEDLLYEVNKLTSKFTLENNVNE